MPRYAIASLLLVAGLTCKGASKSDPASAPAAAAGAAAPGSAAPDTSLADAGPLDATAAASAAPPDESAPPPQGPPPDEVLLVLSGLPDRARVLANRTGPSLDSTAPADGRLVGGFVVARHLGAPLPPALAAWRGHKLALRDDTGVVCTATVASAVALRSGTFWGAVIDWRTDPSRRDQLLAELWAGRPEGATRHHDAVFTAYTLAGETPACRTAYFATAVDRSIKIVRVKAAKPDVERAAYDAFEALGRVGNARSKAALEKLSGVQTISARVLDGGTGPSLVLVYANVNDNREIALWSMPPRSDDTAPPELVELGAVAAPAPSHVVGFDVDRDGAIDAVIGHATGGALVLHRKPGVTFDLTQTFCPIRSFDRDRGDCATPASAEAPLY